MREENRDSLIALLEWELASAQARVNEYRLRLTRIRESAKFRPGLTPASFTSDSTMRVSRRALASVLMLLDEPDDDKRLRQRLESARWEAQQAIGIRR